PGRRDHRRGAPRRRRLHASSAAARGLCDAAAAARGSLMLADFVCAWRATRRMPIVAAVVVASLGVGIGVNTAVFSWVQAVVLKPLPGVADSGRIYLVEPRADTGSYPGVSWLEFGDLRDRLPALSDPIAFRMLPLAVGERGRIERAYGLLVSGNYFEALDLHPSRGRLLRP